MTYESTMQRLQEMESRYNDGFSSLDRSYLDSLYYDLFGREITNKGCGDCYRDAYMEICIKLKKTKAMPKKSDFVLKAGAIITFFGEAKCYSNANLTDEAALRFLALNPNNEKLFESLPSDWQTRLPKSDEVPEEVEDKDAIIARLTQENEKLRKENEDLKTSAPRKKAKKNATPAPDPVAEAPAPEPSADEQSPDAAPSEEVPEETAVDADEVSVEEPEEALEEE